MRLVDKDKLLKELTEGQKAGLGLIEGSEYGNINSIDDAIEAVKYADEINLSEIRTQIINEIKQKLEKYETTRYMDNIHMACPYQAIFIDKKDFNKLFNEISKLTQSMSTIEEEKKETCIEIDREDYE